MKPIFALIDCNNFYASCERIFNPQLVKRPIVVLSNNDGCVIARSSEAKSLGIKMGQPFFEVKHLAKVHNIFVASTNFTLYGDMSQRVMETLRYFTDDIEIYSIDEAFLTLTQYKKSDLTKFGQEIRNTIYQWTGVPVSIGIGATKTLAKAANELAKKNKEYNGVLDFTASQNLDSLLNKVAVNDIWGVGRQYTKLLQRSGIRTALQFKNVSDVWLRNNFNIMGQRTALELRGTACISLEDIPAAKKSIVTSRTFKRPLFDLVDLQWAVASYVSRAAEKLRKQSSETISITVFVSTGRFSPEDYYANSITLKLPQASAYTPELVHYADFGLKKIFREGYRYKRAGIILNGITSQPHRQYSLFVDQNIKIKQDSVMKSVDLINKKWGHNTIRSAMQKLDGIKFMRQNYISPRFTSQWAELPVVRA